MVQGKEDGGFDRGLADPWRRDPLKVVAHLAVLAEVPGMDSYIFLDKPFLTIFIVSNKNIRKL